MSSVGVVAALRILVEDAEPPEQPRRGRRLADGGADLGKLRSRLEDRGFHAAVEAVQKLPPTAGWLVSAREQIAARRGRNIAKVAVARKLLILVYYLRDGHIRALQA